MSGRSRNYIFISAGEASGDWAGALLAQALQRQGWSGELRGVGGKRMREAGVKLFSDSSTWGVIGVLAVIPKLPAAYATRFRALCLAPRSSRRARGHRLRPFQHAHRSHRPQLRRPGYLLSAAGVLVPPTPRTAIDHGREYRGRPLPVE